MPTAQDVEDALDNRVCWTDDPGFRQPPNAFRVAICDNQPCPDGHYIGKRRVAVYNRYSITCENCIKLKDKWGAY